MQGDNNGPPSNRRPRAFWPHSLFDDLHQDPFFSDPFLQGRSGLFQSPFQSMFSSAPFGGLVEELLDAHRGGGVRMQGGNSFFQHRGQPHQALPDPRITEMEPGDLLPASQEQPVVEHPDSDSEEEDEDEGEVAYFEPSSPKSNVRDIPIQWGDDEAAPAHDSRAPIISEVDPELDMDWQPQSASAHIKHESVSLQTRNESEGPRQSGGIGTGNDGQDNAKPDTGHYERERSFPRSWFGRFDRKGTDR